MAKCKFRGYNKVAYTNEGSQSTSCIENAPHSIRWAWDSLSAMGVCIARIRRFKHRNEVSTGDTFHAYHTGKFSFYIPKENPNLPLNFARKVKLGDDNKGMQVFEVATNYDRNAMFDAVQELNSYLNPNFFQRMYRAIFGLNS